MEDLIKKILNKELWWQERYKQKSIEVIATIPRRLRPLTNNYTPSIEPINGNIYYRRN